MVDVGEHFFDWFHLGSFLVKSAIVSSNHI
jgi:hypothetical protein